MQEKMKMILQEDENLVHLQQECSDSFYEKIEYMHFSSRYGILVCNFHDFDDDQIS